MQEAFEAGVRFETNQCQVYFQVQSQHQTEAYANTGLVLANRLSSNHENGRILYKA
jgi:hypothetical protein